MTTLTQQPQTQGDDGVQTRWSALAKGKAAIVQPLINLHSIPPDLMAEACSQAALLLQKKRVTPQTIYNWLRNYKAGGIGALESKEHRDLGMSTLHPDLRQYIEDRLKTTRDRLAKVHRDSIIKAKKMDLDHIVYPTYDQVRFIHEKLSDAAKIYGGHGTRAYRKTNELTGHFEAEVPNHIWQCDHHLLDILIINEETGKPERPWLTVIIDDYSRAIMGYYLSFDNPTSNAIALALHHAMCKKPQELWVMHGIPRLLYVDNGKDFRSKHIEEVCLHFKIERKSHEPYIARSKGKIERWFRTLEEMLIAYLDGYIGSSPQQRPAKVTPKLSLDQLREQIIDFILNTYHERVHSQIKTTPRTRWLEHPTLIQPVNELEDLDYLLESATRTVQNDGIQFQNGKYVDKDGKLTPYIRKEVRIFFNRNDVSTIRVYCRGAEKERFLCLADRNRSAKLIAEQNKTIRRELGNEKQASKRRLKAAAEQPKEASTRAKSPTVSPQQLPPAGPTPIRRYRFEIDEAEDGIDTNV